MVLTTVEKVDDVTVKLTVKVEAQRVREAIDRAARELANNVRVPGFRPGRVPRKVLESRLGKSALVEEAVRDSLPDFYAEAVEAEELPVVGAPSFDVSTFEDGEDAEFTATVEVRPQIEVPDYRSLQIAHPEWEVTDEDVDRELDSLRERFAELESIPRPADDGDYVRVTITARRGSEVIAEAGGEDLLYRIGSGGPDAAIDKALIGVEAGGVVRFTDTLGPDFPEELRGQELSFTALVKDVKRKRLPDLDDDFALTASEFDTLEELRDDLDGQLRSRKRRHARMALRIKVVDAVTDLVDVALPESMVNDELRSGLVRIQRDAVAHGMGPEELAAAVGTSPEGMVTQMTENARQTVKTQLVIDAVGIEAGIGVSTDDLSAQVARQAAGMGQPPEKLAEFMLHPDRIGVLYTDAFRRKTIDHLVAAVQVLGGPPAEEPPSTAPDAEAAAPGAEAPEADAPGAEAPGAKAAAGGDEDPAPAEG